ncbi:MAG TPA: NrfD/PsrC family molybdoenzyme membrane anchor subunit [Anaerolineae bacterium]
MLETEAANSPVHPHTPPWQQPLPQDPALREQVEQYKEKSLLLDIREPGYMDDIVMNPAYTASPRLWLAFLIIGVGCIVMGITWFYQMIGGIGIYGIARPVMWAVYIVNLVYFIGIGHAGTFISAAFRALKIQFRAPISRPAELLTVFGLATAGMQVFFHLGRAWKALWVGPYPNFRGLWPSYHSPLAWDLIAISTYLSCSALFAFLALIPDLAMARDREQRPGWRKRLYEIASLGFRGTEREWTVHTRAMDIFTYAIIPVMFSVHTIVSWDFAMALQPSWHSTVFGPYFVVGALYSGAAAVILILMIIRKFMHLEFFIRNEHMNGMAMFLLILSFTWAYFFFNDYIVPWYGQDPAEKLLFYRFIHGPFPYNAVWWGLILCNIVIPWGTLWRRKWRTSPFVLLLAGVAVNVGMYLERVMIIPLGLSVNELPFDWGVYRLQLPETLITIGSFCLVLFMFFLFVRFFPIIPVWEVKEGQEQHRLRQVGRALVDTRVE